MGIVTSFWKVLALLGLAAAPQTPPANAIIFDNRSGTEALAKTVGTTRDTVFVPHGSQRRVPVAPGDYYILVRYGSSGRYTFSKGREFAIEGHDSSYTEVTITLHKVANGNYPVFPVSQAEFDRH